MPAAKESTASSAPIQLNIISTLPSTSTTSSESRASSSSESSATSTAASTVSPTSLPPLSGSPITPHHASTLDFGTPDTSTQQSSRPNAASEAWYRYVFLSLRVRCRTVLAATKVTYPPGVRQSILAAPNLSTNPTSSQPSQAPSSVSGNVNPLESPSAPTLARILPLLKIWWHKLKETSKFKDYIVGTGGVATLLMTIFGLVYYAHRTDKLARWTAAKDYLEQCRNELSANISTLQCRAALTKHLLPPPYQPDSFYTSTTKRDEVPLNLMWREREMHPKEHPLDLNSISGTPRIRLSTLYPVVPLTLTFVVAAMLLGLCLLIWRLYSPAKAQQIWRRKRAMEDSPVKSADPSIIIRKPLIRQTGIRRRRIFELESEPESEQEYEPEHHHQPQEYEIGEAGTNLPTDGFKTRESDYVAMRNAMQRGDVSGLKALLDFCCDPEARDADGSPILHFFAIHGGPQVDNESQIAMLELLFEYGAQPNTVDARGRNVLCFARTTTDVIVDDYLLSKRVDVTHRDGNSWTPLRYALQYQDSARLKLYLEIGAIYRTGVDYEPIHFLCYFAGSNIPSLLSGTAEENEERTVDCMKLLLDSGVAEMSPASTGCSPFHHAAEKGLIRVIDTLLNYGASMPVTTIYSARCGLGERWDDLHPQSDYRWGTPLDVAVRAGQLDAISHLLNEFTNFTLDRMGSRPQDLLKIACSRPPHARNYFEMVQLLAPRCKSIHWSCLAIAAYDVSQDVIRILLHHGAAVDKNFIMSCACSSRPDKQNREPPLIPILFQREREAVIELLIEAGLPLDANHMEPGPLHMAAGMHPTPAVLLQLAPAESTSRPNLTPDIELCRYLLARGANPLRVDSSGKAPYLVGMGQGVTFAQALSTQALSTMEEKLLGIDEPEEMASIDEELWDGEGKPVREELLDATIDEYLSGVACKTKPQKAQRRK